MSLIKSINTIYRVVKQHIGYGGNAHSTVDDYNDGFMSVDQKKEFDRMKGNPRINLGVDKGLDLLELLPGRYEGGGLRNSPVATGDNVWLEIDVTYSKMSWETTYRKQFIVIKNVSGEVWIRTIHTDGDPESGSGGWLKLTDTNNVQYIAYHSKPIPQNTDILTLSAGRYEGNTLINSPLGDGNGTWLEIEVIESPVDSVSGKRRKQFKVMASASGEIWIRTIHTDGTPGSGTGKWFKINMTAV